MNKQKPTTTSIVVTSKGNSGKRGFNYHYWY